MPHRHRPDDVPYQITERPPDPPPMRPPRPGTVDNLGREYPPDPAYTMPPPGTVMQIPRDAVVAVTAPERANREGDQPLPKAGRYEQLGTELGQLVEKKQAAYGDAFGKSGQIMRVLYPSGIPPEKLDDALTVTRIVDKLFRVATDRDAFGESPWRDVAGYALLAAERHERSR